MPAAMINFLDGEVLYAEIDDLSFDVPVLEARVHNIGSNSDHALLPLSAIRQILIGEMVPAPDAETLEGWERAVFRFLDGQVMRAQIAPGPILGRHGGIWRCVEPGTVDERRLGIPYAALKAVFEVREWDGRTPAERTEPGDESASDSERLGRILAEREDRGRAREAGQALLTRVRRPGHEQ